MLSIPPKPPTAEEDKLWLRPFSLGQKLLTAPLEALTPDLTTTSERLSSPEDIAKTKPSGVDAMMLLGLLATGASFAVPGVGGLLPKVLTAMLVGRTGKRGAAVEQLNKEAGVKTGFAENERMTRLAHDLGNEKMYEEFRLRENLGNKMFQQEMGKDVALQELGFQGQERLTAFRDKITGNTKEENALRNYLTAVVNINNMLIQSTTSMAGSSTPEGRQGVSNLMRLRAVLSAAALDLIRSSTAFSPAAKAELERALTNPPGRSKPSVIEEVLKGGPGPDKHKPLLEKYKIED